MLLDWPCADGGLIRDVGPCTALAGGICKVGAMSVRDVKEVSDGMSQPMDAQGQDAHLKTVIAAAGLGSYSACKQTP